MNKNNIEIEEPLNYFPLRIAVTDYCNLNCFFCSNEGMSLYQKNNLFCDVEKTKTLIKILNKKGLKEISFTGGEPSLHPDILELVEFCGKFNLKNLFFHTNGVFIDNNLIRALLENFSKIAFSLHSTEFDIWEKMTGGSSKNFEKLMENLEYLSIRNKEILIEIKCVLIRGVNDHEKDIKSFLDFCSKYRFKFKILNFEPIIPAHIDLVIPFQEVEEKINSVGAMPMEDDVLFRNQKKYLPVKKFSYGNTWGVVIKIGCGNQEVCRACYFSNEIFITPDFKIKPCHMRSYKIDLEKFIEKEDEEGIYEAILESRNYLAQAPGENLNVWQNKENN
jgi:GTP 3',8-cyclase